MKKLLIRATKAAGGILKTVKL